MNDVVLVFLLLTLNNFTPFSSIYIVDFGQVDVSCVTIKTMFQRVLQMVLSLNVLCISESYVKIKIKLNFYFHFFVVLQKVL